jgi:hypothetical protein
LQNMGALNVAREALLAHKKAWSLTILFQPMWLVSLRVM